MNPNVTLCAAGLLLAATINGLGQGMINGATIQSISMRSNLISLHWSGIVPGAAATVEVSPDLTNPRWAAVPSRYRWPTPITNWGEAARPSSKQRFYRVVTTAIAEGKRGALMSAGFIRAENSATLRSHFGSVGLPVTPGPKYGVQIYKIVYESVDALDVPILCSGALLLPINPTNAVPLLSFQHPTETHRLEAPSRAPSAFTQDGGFLDFVAGEFFAAGGYAVLMPDYLGMGDSPGFQPWLQSKTEAAAVLDLLRASRIFFATNSLVLNGQLFLAGYSQGARASLAAQREIEGRHGDEFTVTASAGLAGSDHLLALFDVILNSSNYSTPFLLAYLLASYLPVYQLADTLEELLASPYADSLPPLLDGLHHYDDFGFMPRAPAKILKPEVRSDYQQNANSAWRRALAENSVLDWAPKAPVLLLHGSGDTMVPFSISETALHTFQAKGACCVTLVDPGAPGELDHFTIYGPGLTAAKAWIDGQVK